MEICRGDARLRQGFDGRAGAPRLWPRLVRFIPAVLSHREIAEKLTVRFSEEESNEAVQA